jgi:hypothetical protein
LPWQPAITFIYGAIHNNKNMSLSAVEASGTDMRYMDQLAELEAKYPDGVFPPDVIDSWPQRTAGMGLFSNDIIELRYKYWTEAFHRLKEIGKIETIHFPREALEGSARSETNAPFYIGIKRNHEIVYYYGQLPLLERNNNNSWIILLP